jgi:hypothetical protein
MTLRELVEIESMSDIFYYVYENWTHERVRVHRSSCVFCNDGHGCHAGTSTAHGQWHGSFASRDDAFAKATALARSNTRACAYCAP